MKNGLVIGVVAIIVLLVIVFVGIKMNSQKNNSVIDNPGIVPTTGDNSNPPANEGSSSAKVYSVDISGFAFSPETLTIKVGDTVKWINQDSAKHTVTSDSGNELNSNLLAKGDLYSYTFTTAGTYEYHCTPHPYMTGKVVVE